MAYHDTITSGPIASISNSEMRVSWVSSSSPGTTFQVYLDRRLAWSGVTTSARFACPQGPVYLDVVAVDLGDEKVDYSTSFVALPPRRATLKWSGGRFLSATIRGFNVYSGTTPGGAVNYAEPVAFVAWTPQGIPQDGFGIGGFGRGGFGRSEIRYSWTSGVLASGAWNFAVAAVDLAGNVGTTITTSEAIAAGPSPPKTLTASVAPSTRVPTLAWTV